MGWPDAPCQNPHTPLAVGSPAQAGFSSKPECLFLPNHDTLGLLPLPNGDSIEPRDSSSELAAYGDPQPPWTLNTRTSTAFSLLGLFFQCPSREQRSMPALARTATTNTTIELGARLPTYLADDAEQAMNRGYTSRASFPSPGRPAPEDSFDVVTVRIEHEGGVVACRIAHCGVP